ncbi:MAG: glycosyltransferase family 4 protein [Patescibacteria group bacterium]
MNKPKILILALTYFPHQGGAEVAVKEITSRLGDDFGFDMVTARLNKKLLKFEQIGNIGVYRVGFGCKIIDKYIFTFFGFFKAIKLYFKNRYLIIWPIMAAYSSFAVLFKIFTRAKVVLTLQEGDPIEYITGLKRFKIFLPIYKLYFKLVDKVTVISNFLGNWAEYLGVKKEKIVLVPNGVNIEVIEKLKAPLSSRSIAGWLPEAASNKVIKSNEKIIFTASRLVEKNGIEYLIKAVKLLITNYGFLDTKLLIAGDGPLKNKLEKIVSELDLDNKIEFLGEVKFEKIKEYYAIADIFCRPSLSEGFGNVFVEAMAAEVPVIATPVGGIPDFLKDRETGWFCEVQNSASIADKIVYILDEKNKAEVDRVVAHARKMVEEKYSWGKIARDMGEIFLQIINNQDTNIKK